jgi:hypothetical protein
MGTEILGALLRHGLSTVGAVAATDGASGGDEVQALIGALVTVISLAWSIYRKWKGAK